LDPPHDINLVFVEKILHLFLEKSTKTAATRAALSDSNMHQIVCRLRLRPWPNWESLLRKKGEVEGERRKERGVEERGGKGGRGGMEFVLCPRKRKENSAPMPGIAATEDI